MTDPALKTPIVDIDISRSQTFSLIFREIFLTDTPNYKLDATTYGAVRTSWTYHTAFTVSQTSRTMDLICRFEARGRRDAVIETKDDNPETLLFAEWEWDYTDVFGKGKEIDKLKDSSRSEKKADAFLLTYCPEKEFDDYWQKVAIEWLTPKRTKIIEASLFLHIICFTQNLKSRTFQTLHSIEINKEGITIWTALNF
jgi:hypothetical protein